MDEAISRSHRTTKKATTGLSARPILTAMSPRANPALDELTPDSDPGPLPWQPLVDYALDAAAGVMLSFFSVQVVFPQDLWDRPAQSHISPLSTEELLHAIVYPLIVEMLMPIREQSQLTPRI